MSDMCCKKLLIFVISALSVCSKPIDFNILCYFVHQRLLVPFFLGVLFSCSLCLCVCAYRPLSYMYTQRVLNK